MKYKREDLVSCCGCGSRDAASHSSCRGTLYHRLECVPSLSPLGAGRSSGKVQRRGRQMQLQYQPSFALVVNTPGWKQRRVGFTWRVWSIHMHGREVLGRQQRHRCIGWENLNPEGQEQLLALDLRKSRRWTVVVLF